MYYRLVLLKLITNVTFNKYNFKWSFIVYYKMADYIYMCKIFKEDIKIVKSSELCARLWEKRFSCNGTSSAPIKSLHSVMENTWDLELDGMGFGSWLIHLAFLNFF